REREPGIEAIELCGAGVSLFIHASRPEPATRVGAAVVEAVMRRIVGCVGDLAFRIAVAIDKPEPVPQRGDETSAPAQRETADGGWHGPHGVPPRERIEAVERRSVDVDPVENLLVGRPYRALAQARLDVEHTLKRGRHLRDRARRKDASYKKTLRPARA